MQNGLANRKTERLTQEALERLLLALGSQPGRGRGAL